MKQRINPDVDVVLQVLTSVAAAKPHSRFIQSLLQQYRDRGGLSKKQLEGLLGKAREVTEVPVAKLATLEAIILKKHSKQRSVATIRSVVVEQDIQIGSQIEAILQKYPQHKRVLFLKNKYDADFPLTPAESDELKRFTKLLSP